VLFFFFSPKNDIERLFFIVNLLPIFFVNFIYCQCFFNYVIKHSQVNETGFKFFLLL
jgi:hypothetical protein